MHFDIPSAIESLNCFHLTKKITPVINVSYDYEIVGQHFPIISHYLCCPAQPLLLNYSTLNEIEVAVNGGRSYADAFCQYPTSLHALTIQSIELQLSWIFSPDISTVTLNTN